LKIAQNIAGLTKAFNRLSKKEKGIFYFAVLFVFLALLDRLIIGPASNKIAALNKGIQENELFIKRDSRIVAQKEMIVNEKNKFSSFLSSAQSQDEQFTIILKEIEELSNKSSVSIGDMKPAGVKKVDIAEKYFVNVNCEAKIEALVNFMYDVENSKYLLTIEKYQIAPKPGDTQVASITMVISKLVVHKQ